MRQVHVSRIWTWRCLREQTAQRWVALARASHDAHTEYGDLMVGYTKRWLGWEVRVDRLRDVTK
jgi:hypothetical protein